MSISNEYQTLDVRGLPPPEPMEKVLELLPNLKAGETIRMLIHREPEPLYGILLANGFEYSTKQLSEESFEVLITRSS